jgi:hypothetical protein
VSDEAGRALGAYWRANRPRYGVRQLLRDAYERDMAAVIARTETVSLYRRLTVEQVERALGRSLTAPEKAEMF